MAQAGAGVHVDVPDHAAGPGVPGREAGDDPDVRGGVEQRVSHSVEISAAALNEEDLAEGGIR
jgi:hypothetical protein